MRVNRILLAAPLVVLAQVFQVSALARLHLPGAVPDLLLLVVLALALTYGPVGGCLIGFGAGLLADLTPPADHAAGRYALVLCLIGYLAGLVKPESGQVRSAVGPMAVVALAAITSTVLYAGVGALVGDTAARHVGMVNLLTTALVYDLLLAPFTVPWIMALARRVEHDPMAAAGGDAVNATPGEDGWLGNGFGGGRFGSAGQLNGTGRIRSGKLRAVGQRALVRRPLSTRGARGGSRWHDPGKPGRRP